MDRIIEQLAEQASPNLVTEGAWKEIAKIIGLKDLIKILEIIGGTTIYAPKAEALIRPLRDMQIKAEFNGYNHQELARKYNLTERYMRELCGNGIVEGQITLWET